MVYRVIAASTVFWLVRSTPDQSQKTIMSWSGCEEGGLGEREEGWGREEEGPPH